MLEFKEVQKKYYGRVVLNIPSLQLRSGIVWIQGLNGSGKTTMLKTVAGLISFQGDILLTGISQNKQPLQYRKRIGWSAAEPLYPDFLKGEDLIRFYKKIRNAGSYEIQHLINLFGIESYMSKTLGTYSSGMTKRISLMLAFIGNPELIILDEPLATLDIEMALLLPRIMTEHQYNHNTSFIFSSHHPFPGEYLTIDEKLSISEGILINDNVK